MKTVLTKVNIIIINYHSQKCLWLVGAGDIISGSVWGKSRLFFTCKCGDCKNRKLKAFSFPVLLFLKRGVKCSFHPFITPGEREEMAPACCSRANNKPSLFLQKHSHTLALRHTLVWTAILISLNMKRVHLHSTYYKWHTFRGACMYWHMKH